MIKPNSPNRQISGPHGYIKLQQTVQTTILYFSGCSSPKYLALERFLNQTDFVHLELFTNVETPTRLVASNSDTYNREIVP